MDPCLRKFLTIGAFRKVPSASFVSSGFQALFFGQLRICTSTSIFSHDAHQTTYVTGIPL